MLCGEPLKPCLVVSEAPLHYLQPSREVPWQFLGGRAERPAARLHLLCSDSPSRVQYLCSQAPWALCFHCSPPRCPLLYSFFGVHTYTCQTPSPFSILVPAFLLSWTYVFPPQLLSQASCPRVHSSDFLVLVRSPIHGLQVSSLTEKPRVCSCLRLGPSVPPV